MESYCAREGSGEVAYEDTGMNICILNAPTIARPP